MNLPFAPNFRKNCDKYVSIDRRSGTSYAAISSASKSAGIPNSDSAIRKAKSLL